MALKIGSQILFLAGLFAVRLVSASEPTLFLIHSYAPNPWTSGIRESLLHHAILSAMPLKEYYFDSDYWLKKGDLNQAQDLKLRQLLATVSPNDLVIISDDEAAAVALPQIPKDASTLVIGINATTESPDWNFFCNGKPNRAILFEDYPYGQALNLAKATLPKIAEIHAIGADTSTSKAILRGVEAFLRTKNLHLKDQLASADWAAWRKYLLAVNRPNSLTWIFVPFGLRDSMNEEVDPHLVSRWIAENVKSTTIGALALGNSVNITVGINPRDVGREGAFLAEKLLYKKKLRCRNAIQSYKITSNQRSLR